MRLILAVLLLAILIVLPLLAPEFERPGKLYDYRKQSGAQTITSTHGLTRYARWGDERKPTVLLIHSFNGYLETWQPNIDALVDAGFHMVAYDLFGRGLSDRPLKPYTLPLFREQINALRKELKLNRPLHIIGASFGCVVATDYALQNPDAVRSLVLTGPAGWPNKDDSLKQLVELPFAGEYVFHYAGKPLLQSKVDSYLLNREDHPWATAYWKIYYQFPGVSRAALSTLRHSPVLDYTTGWRALGASKLPVQIIWGRQDSSFPYAHTRLAEQLIPQAEIAGIDGAEHWVNVDQAEETNRIAINFLKAQH